MYPHSADNSFLGFLVDTHNTEISPTAPPTSSSSSSGLVKGNTDSPSLVRPSKSTIASKRDIALVYGKEIYMWKGAERYLSIVKDFAEVHATVNVDGTSIRLPRYVINHGVLSGPQLHALLHRSKLFLGLGFPYEGPAPLEAIANGAIYINPRFSQPKSRKTEKFFSEKPTLRSLRSQNPYAEDFIGEPYVITVDIADEEAVRAAIEKAMKTDVAPFLPYEFTAEGMLERVNAFVEHQDFCLGDTDANWPPFSAHRFLIGPLASQRASEAGSGDATSCGQVCWTNGLICEPSYFRKMNVDGAFERYSDGVVKCTNYQSIDSLSIPSFEPASGRCWLQSSPLLYSCAAPAELGHRRLCPCRDYIKDQTALCAACL